MTYTGILDLDSVSALYEEGTYFNTQSAFHAVGRPSSGMEGELLPYALKNDLLVSGILVCCFLLLCFVLNKGKSLIIHQLKDFFVERKRGNMFVETESEFRYQFFLISHAACMLGLVLFALFLQPSGTGNLYPSWISILICLAACAGLYAFKFLAYSFVNWVFFERFQRERWMEVYALVISLQGVLLFPLACALVYFDFDTKTGLIVLLVLLSVGKLLLFCKSFSIFFGKIYGLLCNILYFCTLEMIPMLFLLKVISEINPSWTIKL